MRKLMFSALVGLGALGFTGANEAKASWLSEALNNSRVSVNIGIGWQYPTYPAYPAPVYAPVPVYAQPVYRPAPSYPVYRPVPVYNPSPVVAVPVYRPAPANSLVPVRQHGNVGQNPYRNDWNDHQRNDRDWRR